MIRRLMLGSALVVALLTTATAQDGQAPIATVGRVDAPLPMLTLEQKQAIQILAQRIEIAQLRAQAAQFEFDKARADISQMMQSLQKPGFDLDLQQMAYVKKADKKEAAEKKE